VSSRNGASKRVQPEVVAAYRGHRAAVEKIFWSPTGESIISCDVMGVVHTWDVQSGVMRASYAYSQAAARDIALSFDGRALAVCDDDGVVRVWDVSTGKQLAAYTGHQEAPLSVSWSPDGAQLVSAQRNAAHIWCPWEQARLSRVLSLDEEGDPYFAQALWSAGGERIYTSVRDIVGVWRADSGVRERSWKARGDVMLVAWSPDDSLLALSGDDGVVRVVDVWGEERIAYRGHTDIVWALAFSPDGKRIASGGCDTTVQVWDEASGKTLCSFREHSGWVNGLAWSPDGTCVASGDDERVVLVWAVEAA